MKTLVVLGNHEFGARQYHHGEELAPDVLSPAAIDWCLDNKWLAESERRSIYRLFPMFSGCSERELLSQDESRRFAL